MGRAGGVTFGAETTELMSTVLEDTVIKLPYPAGKTLHADEYLFAWQLPYFFFHVTTAYNLLRQGGVDLGKRDYLGPLNLIDA